MNFKKIIAITLPVLIVWIILHQLFIIDFRFAKEEYLIKRNYHKNILQFTDLSKELEVFPKLRIDFSKGNHIDLSISSIDLFESHHEKYVESNMTYPEISWLELTDTSRFLYHKNHQLLVFDFWKIDSNLFVKSQDSIIKINTPWQLSYKGYLKTNQINQVYNIANINEEIIGEIKNKLISLNCFGYEKSLNEDLIINYRGNGIDFFSYLILNDTINNSFFNNSYTSYGKISSNLYWYNNERIHVSYTPYLKLRSRNIE